MVSGASLYAGAAVAVGLFAAFPPVVVAWFRITGAAVLLLALRRPPLHAFCGKAGLSAAVFGVVTMAMNMTFYAAINSMPLGTAVAVEFLGPVLVAAWGSRSRRDWLALGMATVGVFVISGASWANADGGILWALAAGLLWAGYIVVGSRLSQDSGVSRMAMPVGFSYGALAGLPLAVWLWPENPTIAAAPLLGLILGLGLLSAAIPYSLDQVVLRLAGASHFALLQAILPLVAAVIGAVALGQWLSVAEVCGVLLVICAVALRRP